MNICKKKNINIANAPISPFNNDSVCSFFYPRQDCYRALCHRVEFIQKKYLNPINPQIIAKMRSESIHSLKPRSIITYNIPSEIPVNHKAELIIVLLNTIVDDK